jgi:hypothetical protein
MHDLYLVFTSIIRLTSKIIQTALTLLEYIFTISTKALNDAKECKEKISR